MESSDGVLYMLNYEGQLETYISVWIALYFEQRKIFVTSLVSSDHHHHCL